MKPSWPTKKLGEVCEIISPGIEKFDGVKKYVATADVDFDRIINFAGITYKNRPSRANMEVQEKDVLVARMAEAKKFLMADKTLQNNYIFSTGFAVLRTKKDLLPKYLFYFFYTKDFNLQKDKLAVGATQKAINNPALKKIKIPIPPISIQQKIVEKLDAIKKAQKLNDKQIALADELFQSLLHRELNPKGKNWEIKKLGDVAIFKRGPFGGSLKKEIFVERGYKVYEQKNVINNDFTIGNYFINEKKYREMIDFAIHPSDLIISCSGTIGKVVKVPEKVHPRIINQALLKITPLRNIIIGDFLKFVIETSVIQERLTANTRGSAIRNVASVKEIKRIKIPLPPLETQRKIVEKLSAVQDYKKKLLEQKQKLQELFDSVLNKSIKGELI